MLLKTCRATAEFAKGIPQREIPALPTVKEPETWEFSAHPHKAERAGEHIDLRLGDPKSGVAHSLVLPKGELPAPGKSALVIPTFGHTLEYMDYTGPIEKGYGKGVVTPGRRTRAEVYHADPSPGPGTKLRFNLYEGAQPEEYAVRKDDKGRWFLHNKTQTRAGRPDIPDFKPKYKEIDVDDVDPTNEQQAMMPKLDGAHGIIDLIAGRAPRVFSYRVGKKAETGFIEHTHKMPELLKKKVPKELDRTVLRGEILGIKGDRVLPAEQIGGLLNSKVWKSLETQKAEGVRLKAFPFDVVKYRGRPASERSFGEKLELLRKVEEKLRELQPPPVVVDPKEKIELLNLIRAKKHSLTDEGVVLVDKDTPGRPIKARFTPDFDVFVRDVHPAVSGDTGEAHDRAGSISYSWSPDGPIAGQLGGFKHQEARDMLARPGDYIGRVAKVKAMRVFTDDEGNPKALFQPRFKEWHLDKGDIEKQAKLNGFVHELEKLSGEKVAVDPLTLLGVGAGSHLLANLAMRGAHGTKFLKGVRARGLARGVREALEGAPRGVKSKALETWVGPELTAPESIGRALGQKLRGLPEGQRYRLLKKLRKQIAMTPELRHAPLTEDIVPGVNRALASALPKPGAVREAGALAKAAPYAPVPLLAAAEPAALVHAGINKLRLLTARSAPGKRFMAKGLRSGALESELGTVLGRAGVKTEGLVTPMSSAKEKALDVLVSPAALNTRRLGKAVGELAARPEGAKRLAKIHGALSPATKGMATSVVKKHTPSLGLQGLLPLG